MEFDGYRWVNSRSFNVQYFSVQFVSVHFASKLERNHPVRPRMQTTVQISANRLAL
jgi:hypothetical protein